MILFIEDHPQSIKYYLKALEDRKYEYSVFQSIKEAISFINTNPDKIDLIVLDVMFPDDCFFDSKITSNGLTTGMPLFASIRSKLPQTPIIILTSSSSLTVEKWFKSQEFCFFYRKLDLLLDKFIQLIESVIFTNHENLIQRLMSCPKGKADWLKYQDICLDIIRYLFVPPMDEIKGQVSNSNKHEIRDAIMPNSATSTFWSRVLYEFSAKHIVFEFKNYDLPIEKGEVQQLMNYLTKRSIGHFGILISREKPSESALIERQKAYIQQNILILFLNDLELMEMIDLRRKGKDPTNVLSKKKIDFELSC